MIQDKTKTWSGRYVHGILTHYINVVSKVHGVPLKFKKSIHLHSSYLST